VVVHSAGIQDRDGAQAVFRQAWAKWTRLLWIWADGGYTGAIRDWAWQQCQWFVGIVKRPEGRTGWVLLPHRWVVERTFAWLDRCRRLSKDYEFHPETSETWIRISMIHLMVRRLKPERHS
jgi:putative transposase